MRLEIPNLNDVIQGELAVPGGWVVACVAGALSWPVTTQKVNYRGRELFIIPTTEEHYPAVACRAPGGGDQADVKRDISSFLSVLSWVENAGIRVEYWTGGSFPNPMALPRGLGRSIRERFDLDYLPQVADEKALLALALYREGLSLNDPAYAFLSFFRVLEVRYKRAAEIVAWIDNHLGLIKTHRALQVLGQLQATHSNLGRYLYSSGRCAVAHASGGVIINPDEPGDKQRLDRELPVMEALAQLMIEEEFGVETSQTVWRKHLYELAGFKKRLDPDLVSKIINDEEVAPGTMVDLPSIGARIRQKPAYAALARLEPKNLWRGPGQLVVAYESPDHPIRFVFALDFREERLEFAVESDMKVVDDGTAAGANAVADAGRFMRDYYLNGELLVVDADTGEELSRKDAFIPLNVRPNRAGFDMEIEGWVAKAKEREAAQSGA